MSRENAPIVVKRRAPAGEEGHHGGAWKVAYADFVTAMMAFFMLMWLLNATTEKQRKGLADYFSPTVAISRASGGGDGALGGDSLTTDQTLALVGRGGITASTDHGTADDAALAALAAAVMGKGGDSLLDDAALRHVSVHLTDEGLVIEMFAAPGAPLFQAGAALPTALLRDLVASLGPLLRDENRQIALNAHVPARPVVSRAPAGWSLSTERALSLQALVLDYGVPEHRLQRLTGHADRSPAIRDRTAPRNERAEIVLLRRGAR